MSDSGESLPGFVPPPAVTIEEMEKELAREIAMRKGLYPQWVRNGRLKPAEADRRIQVMTAIREMLQQKKAAA